MKAYPTIPQGYWPLIDRLASLVEKEQPSLVAIDGRCGSGKTQLAQLIAQALPCHVIHMDDFYLPFAQRSPQRMASPGGHINHERLTAQVLAPSRSGEPIELQVYDCHADQLGDVKHLSPLPLTIVEGSYSHHPALQGYWDLNIFLTCQPAEQQARLLQRQGADSFAQFLSHWMPLEETYFDCYEIERSADMVVDTSEFFG